MIPFYPECTFTPTEICLLEVINEPRFTAREKYRLLDSYYPVISRRAFAYIGSRIIFIEELKQALKKS